MKPLEKKELKEKILGDFKEFIEKFDELLGILVYGSSVKDKFYFDIDVALVFEKFDEKIYEKMLDLLDLIKNREIYDIKVFNLFDEIFLARNWYEFRIVWYRDFHKFYDFIFNIYDKIKDLIEDYEYYLKNLL